ncbi:MAG: hypothetical protein JOY90_19125 [Bradyrhizobium sp.]|uniref:SGNH/GDSL hydrolase family protein n=1 Tax=Bradyrhizobium sp. TaxID=376 RepID=UPI001DDDE924|nr:hypothetical protein [Bradyrhizobium sp.]MBV9562531.1 hypothetical protein [Bradyrhizobium sp.]
MISGYPHQGGGLFEVGCSVVERKLSRPVQSAFVSLGGFPAPRAAKYLKSRVLSFKPLYVVLQFGATDAQCPMRTRSRSSDAGRSRPGSGDDYHKRPSTALSLLRWEVASMLGHLRRIESITPLPSFIAAIEHMVDNCRSAGSTPVVLSPFVYGSRYTMGRALSYSAALHERYASARDVIVVDCVSLLTNFPKRSILQHDGFHLTQYAQGLVGEAVGRAIVDDIRAKDGPCASTAHASAGNVDDVSRTDTLVGRFI